MNKELKIDLSVYVEIDTDLTDSQIGEIVRELINLIENDFEYHIYQAEVRERLSDLREKISDGESVEKLLEYYVGL